jgi:glycine/serine hydroxymethyltransferase
VNTALAMSLPHGGHLTHGSKVNFSGKWFNVVSDGVRQDTELIDYDAAAATRHWPTGPGHHLSAVPRPIRD